MGALSFAQVRQTAVADVVRRARLPNAPRRAVGVGRRGGGALVQVQREVRRRSAGDFSAFFL
jgi:hypothetical protein